MSFRTEGVHRLLMFSTEVAFDIVTSNWEGFHRIFTLNKNSFTDIATLEFREPSKIRTTIVADFDNDGYDEIFLNNIGEPNKLFKILEEGNLQPIQITEEFESTGLGVLEPPLQILTTMEFLNY